MRKIRFIFLLAVITAVGVCSGIASADVIWNTFGPGDVFDGTQGSAIFSAQTMANQFTVSGNDYLFDELEFPASVNYGTNLLNVSLRADNSGAPGSIIESFLVSGLPTDIAGIRSVNSALHPTLQSGTSYWIVMAPGASDSSGCWPKNWGLSGTVAYGPGSSWTVGEDYANIFRVSGSAVVPEPSSLMAMFAGLGSLGGILRRRRR